MSTWAAGWSASWQRGNRYLAYFDSAICGGCAFADRCPAEALKRKPRHVLRFSQREIDLALRRKRCADLRGSRQNLRAAAESTMRSIKHPFGMGKVPVWGEPRVSMMVIGSAAMTNIRRIQRYQEKLREEKRKASAVQKQMEEAIQNVFVSFWGFLQRALFPDLHSKVAAVRLPIWVVSEDSLQVKSTADHLWPVIFIIFGQACEAVLGGCPIGWE